MTVPGRKLDVELVEGDGDLDAFEASGAPEVLAAQAEAAPRRPWTWRRITRAWPIVVVALVLAVVYGVTGARERAKSERIHEALSGQLGYFEDLSGPLRPLWSSGGFVGTRFPMAAIGDTVLVRGMQTEGEVVAALDEATGEQRWAVATEGIDSSRYCAWPLLEAYEARPAVICGVSTFSFDEDGTEDEYPYVVEHRDLATGELIATSGERLAKATTAAGARLAELVSADGVTELQFMELDGSNVQTTRLLDRELAPGDYSHIYSDGGVVVVSFGSRAFVVDAAGRVVVDHAFDTGDSESELADSDFVGPSYYGHIEVLPDGTYAASMWDADPRTWLFDEDGALLLERDDALRYLVLDDGSLGDVALFGETVRYGEAGEAGEVAAEVVLVDLATGDELLRLDALDGVGLVLDGSLVLRGKSTLRSVDVASGEERWSVDTSGQVFGSDGVAVLVSEQDGLTVGLRAFDLDSGTELWSVTDVSTGSWFAPIEGVLYLYGDGPMSRYGR